MCSLYPFIALLSNGGICDRAEPHSALDAASPAQLKTDFRHPQLADLLPLALAHGRIADTQRAGLVYLNSISGL